MNKSKRLLTILWWPVIFVSGLLILLYPYEKIPDLLNNYGVLISSIVALFLGGGGGRFLKERFYKPILSISENLIPVYQHYGEKDSNDLRIWRLGIKNIGFSTANIQADVVSVIDNTGSKRTNFVPLPLQWMHHAKKDISISPKQTAYLDVLKLVLAKSPQSPWMQFATAFASNIPGFIMLNLGTSIFNLIIYERKGGSYNVEVKVEWNGEHSEVTTNIIQTNIKTVFPSEQRSS